MAASGLKLTHYRFGTLCRELVPAAPPRYAGASGGLAFIAGRSGRPYSQVLGKPVVCLPRAGVTLSLAGAWHLNSAVPAGNEWCPEEDSNLHALQR